VAYIDVQNMYGAPIAMRNMDQFLCPNGRNVRTVAHVCVGGIQQGRAVCAELGALNAIRACLYLDAPVCDFRAGRPAEESPRLGRGLAEIENKYMALPKHRPRAPIESGRFIGTDRCGRHPDHACTVMRYRSAAEENICCCRTFKALASHYVIAKPGVGHHPHSLADPTPLSSFILSHVTRNSLSH